MEFTEEKVLKTVRDILASKKKSPNKLNQHKPKAYTVLSFFDIKCIRVLTHKSNMYIALPKHLRYVIEELKIDFITMSDGWTRIPIPDVNSLYCLSELILTVYDYCHEKSTGEAVGCCHKYVECSDAKTCVQEDKEWASGCLYRKNLLKGKIFYGINANIGR